MKQKYYVVQDKESLKYLTEYYSIPSKPDRTVYYSWENNITDKIAIFNSIKEAKLMLIRSYKQYTPHNTYILRYNPTTAVVTPHKVSKLETIQQSFRFKNIEEILLIILKDGYSIVPYGKNEIALFMQTRNTKMSYPCKNIKQLIKVYMKLKANKDG